jgi:hypothetical protein
LSETAKVVSPIIRERISCDMERSSCNPWRAAPKILRASPSQ